MSLFIGSPCKTKKKSVTSFGADNGFCISLFYKIRPLSTPCLAADKYIYYEENNKANKVGNG